MKKNVIIICLSVIALIVAVIGLNLKNNTISDSIKFKNEYESLNNDHKEVNISAKNPIKYSNYEEIKEVLTSGTGVIYFGFPECPWCRNAVPVLLESAEELNLKKIYYFNALDIRDKKSLDDNGNIVTEKEGTKEYYELVQILDKYLTPYAGLNDDSIKRLYFPTVVFVKEGKILGIHVSTVDSQKDPKKDLTEKQKVELKNIYNTYISQILGLTCPVTGEAC